MNLKTVNCNDDKTFTSVNVQILAKNLMSESVDQVFEGIIINDLENLEGDLLTSFFELRKKKIIKDNLIWRNNLFCFDSVCVWRKFSIYYF